MSTDVFFSQTDVCLHIGAKLELVLAIDSHYVVDAAMARFENT